MTQIPPNAVIPFSDGTNLPPEEQINQLGVDPKGMIATAIMKLGGQVVAVTKNPNSSIKQ